MVMVNFVSELTYQFCSESSRHVLDGVNVRMKMHFMLMYNFSHFLLTIC